MCVPSNDGQHYEKNCEQYLDFCETHTLSAPLGSSVLLPCKFITSSHDWVSWAHTSGENLVNLTSEGRINFLLPKGGRVKVFPNQGSKGDYSISIDELEDSDLGCYYCRQGDECLQMELVAAPVTQREMWLLIYICAGMAAFMLLSVFSYVLYNNRKQNNTNNPVGADTEGACAPPHMNMPEQQRGADNIDLVYENNDQDPANQQGDPTRHNCRLPGVLHYLDRTQPTQDTSGIYPNVNQFNSEREESQRKKLRFHRELINRLRQASFSQHYYVNQSELSQQQAESAQANNHHRAHEYQNPIYNRSNGQLNHL
ncbi:uncharacterized protein LOC120791517 isoform X2 [Xiphias gladius]|uniref:uncharacterized protein LOC120791517 isoform X2 n=1 Tax=Xiphias gladius TaxID=8245 RepID=UPI001A99EBA5|nr:uncharacterized protein LOC120791517 isoform X2 [Xiphias gladius]